MTKAELLALTYNDIDLEKRTISVNKSYQRIEGRDIITPPKTPKSKRIITIPPFLTEELKEYTSHLYGIMADERMFRFTKSYMEHEIIRGIKASGVKRIRLHDIRHPYVKHKTKSFLRNSRVFKADFCAPSHSLCTEVFHFPDNINLISGVNIHTFNQCVSQGGI